MRDKFAAGIWQRCPPVRVGDDNRNSTPVVLHFVNDASGERRFWRSCDAAEIACLFCVSQHGRSPH